MQQHEALREHIYLLVPSLLGHATTIIECFAHLPISNPDRNQNLLMSLLCHLELLHKIPLQSVHNLVSNVAYKQASRQTNKPARLKTVTSFCQ